MIHLAIVTRLLLNANIHMTGNCGVFMSGRFVIALNL